MADLFEEYEKQYLEYLNTITNDIRTYKTSKGKEKKKMEEDLVSNFSKADRLLNDMEREQVSEINTSKREQLKKRYENYIKNLKQQRKDFKEAKEQKEKEELFGNEEKEEIEDGKWTSEQGRQKLKDNTDMLSGQQKYIDQMQSVIIETEDIANNAGSNLSGQGERIRGQIDKVSGIGDHVQGARTIIGRMTRQQVIQSIVLVVIILVLIIVIGIIIFFVIRPYLPSWGNSGGSGSSA